MVRRKGPDLDEATIRHELEGNICRCTGYHNIVRSIEAGAQGDGRSKRTETSCGISSARSASLGGTR